MSVTNTILESIKQISDLNNDMQNITPVIIGTVLSIDGSTCTIQPADATLSPITNVLLSSDANSTPTFIPALGTQVSVSMFSNSAGVVVGHGATKSAAIAGDTYGGLVIGSDLITKLNNIENLLNSFITLFNSHTHGGVTVGTAFTLVPIPIETQQLTPTIVSDIVSTTVVHGNGTSNKTAYQASLDEAQSTYDASLELYGSLVKNYNDSPTKQNQDNIERQGVIVQTNLDALNKIINNPQ